MRFNCKKFTIESILSHVYDDDQLQITQKDLLNPYN
jgi:hypothetical protein